MSRLSWLLIGGVVGWFLAWVDRLVYVYWSHPQTQLSQHVKYRFGKRDIKGGVRLLKQRRSELEELGFRSALFQGAWVLVAVFALTSTTSWFGKALVMGLGLHILVDEWRDYITDKKTLKRWLFWQIKREISDDELKWYLYIMTGLFGWLSWLLV